MVLRAEKISKQFIRKSRGSNIFTALEETELALPEGKLCIILGRSGSGKSTLMNILAGILEPTTGKVFADERDLYAMDDEELSRFRNENFGFIPQGQSAVGSLTVLENVLLPYSLYGEGKDAQTPAWELLEMFGIAELAEVKPAELSGGELRRMAIARALVRKPKIVFADEPTGDLDDVNTQIVLRRLRAHADNGASVLLATHESEARRYADLVWRMSGGVLSRQSG